MPADFVFGGNAENHMPYRQKSRPEIDARFKRVLAESVKIIKIIFYSLFAIIFEHLKITIVRKLLEFGVFYGFYKQFVIAVVVWFLILRFFA